MFYAISALGRTIIWLKWLRLDWLVIPFRVLVYISVVAILCIPLIGMGYVLAYLVGRVFG